VTTEVAAGLSGIAALLTVVAGWTVISALKLVRRVESYVPPSGASRVPNTRKRGDLFPWRLLPREVRTQVFRDTVVFLFLSEGCPICTDLLPSLGAFVRGYSRLRFVVCSASPLSTTMPRGVLTVTGKDLLKTLSIGLVPYAMKVDRMRIVDYGIVDTPERLESILEATSDGGLE
jgi:hypothetical protein